MADQDDSPVRVGAARALDNRKHPRQHSFTGFPFGAERKIQGLTAQPAVPRFVITVESGGVAAPLQQTDSALAQRRGNNRNNPPLTNQYVCRLPRSQQWASVKAVG